MGTPLRVLIRLKARNLDVKDSLQMLVVYEAGLVSSVGFESGVKEVLRQ
jgi:superfamily II DNA/RNA helicase